MALLGNSHNNKKPQPQTLPAVVSFDPHVCNRLFQKAAHIINSEALLVMALRRFTLAGRLCWELPCAAPKLNDVNGTHTHAHTNHNNQHHGRR